MERGEGGGVSIMILRHFSQTPVLLRESSVSRGLVIDFLQRQKLVGQGMIVVMLVMTRCVMFVVCVTAVALSTARLVQKTGLACWVLVTSSVIGLQNSECHTYGAR